MSIHFKTVAKKNNLTENSTAKYYAQAVVANEISFKALLQRTAKASNMNIVDATRFYYNLEAIMQQELANGNVVRLGGIGSFQIGIGSPGFDTSKQVTSLKINKKKVNYRPGKAFKEMLKFLEFIKV